MRGGCAAACSRVALVDLVDSRSAQSPVGGARVSPPSVTKFLIFAFAPARRQSAPRSRAPVPTATRTPATRPEPGLLTTSFRDRGPSVVTELRGVALADSGGS